MTSPYEKIYWSSLAIENLIKGVSEEEVIINIQPDGNFILTLPRLASKKHTAEVDFVPKGTVEKSKSYELGKVNALIQANDNLTKMHNQLTNYKVLVQQQIDTVRQTYGPDIHPNTREKIDNLMVKLDVMSFNPKLAKFGTTCQHERQLLDRCYVGNQDDVVACQDYAIQFKQCVYDQENQL